MNARWIAHTVPGPFPREFRAQPAEARHPPKSSASPLVHRKGPPRPGKFLASGKRAACPTQASELIGGKNFFFFSFSDPGGRHALQLPFRTQRVFFLSPRNAG